MTRLVPLYTALADHLERHEPWPGFAPLFRRCSAKGSDPFAERSSTDVGGWIGAAFATAREPLAVRVRDALPALVWRQNPTYRDVSFLARYAYCELVCGAHLTAGLLALAPDTHYPAHAHPAEEVYHLLAGKSEWRRGDEPWTHRLPGARIEHPSNVPHAMRALSEPLLALYLWRGAIAEPARLTSSS
jgi:hypothetical protein